MSDDAIPAATLVVWRDGAGGPQILVVQRSAKMAFAAGAIVFPGGRVDPADHDLAVALGFPEEAAKVTAIRETIEETGVAPAIKGKIHPSLGLQIQESLHAGASFATLLADHDLGLDLDALTPFTRWMPAFKQPRKFDTLFYRRGRAGRHLGTQSPGRGVHRGRMGGPGGVGRAHCQGRSSGHLPDQAQSRAIGAARQSAGDACRRSIPFARHHHSLGRRN